MLKNSESIQSCLPWHLFSPQESTKLYSGSIKVIQFSQPRPSIIFPDCFKYRNKSGLDTAIEALKLYREKKHFKPEDLMQFA